MLEPPDILRTWPQVLQGWIKFKFVLWGGGRGTSAPFAIWEFFDVFQDFFILLVILANFKVTDQGIFLKFFV
jgi:hypothetical protein